LGQYAVVPAENTKVVPLTTEWQAGSLSMPIELLFLRLAEGLAWDLFQDHKHNWAEALQQLSLKLVIDSDFEF